MKKLLIIISILLAAVGVATLVLRPNESTQQPQIHKTTPISQEDVSKHNNLTDCWMIIEDKVYDITDFVSSHPGGNEIERGCGRDATSLFQTRKAQDGQSVGSGTPHSQVAEQQLKKYQIGVLKPANSL